MKGQKYFSQWLLLSLTLIFLMICQAGKAQQSTIGVAQPEESMESLPLLDLELSGETFFKQGFSSGRNFMGLAAIMVDLSGSLNPQLSFSGAIGFDSSLWQDFLNTPATYRYQPQSQAEMTPAVEAFSITWTPEGGPFSVTAGRMISGIGFADHQYSADSYFNFNPRIFTEYWGDNAGLSLDGIRGQWKQQYNELTTTLMVEAAKNGYDSEQVILTTIFDIGLKAGPIEISSRWFGYFDHQEHEHPSLRWHTLGNPDSFVCEGMGFNAWGAAVNSSWEKNGLQKAIIQLQFMNRKLGNTFMTGSYAFLVWNHTPRLSSSLMLQHLERPVFPEASLEVTQEQGILLGMAYVPLPGHRLCLEYNYFENSSFYGNMLVAKWNFFIPL